MSSISSINKPWLPVGARRTSSPRAAEVFHPLYVTVVPQENHVPTGSLWQQAWSHGLHQSVLIWIVLAASIYFILRLQAQADEVRVITQAQDKALQTLTSSLAREQKNLNKIDNSIETLTANVAQLRSEMDGLSKQCDAGRRRMDHLAARLRIVEQAAEIEAGK